MVSAKNILAVVALSASAVSAHYANMALEGVTCYIYNGIKGTEQGHMIVRNANGTWFDHDVPANQGNITVIHNQKEYDALPVKTKVGIVCAPDDVDTTEIGIPYVEMEPTDEEFYAKEQTVYSRSLTMGNALGKRFNFECIIRFCRGNN